MYFFLALYARLYIMLSMIEAIKPQNERKKIMEKTYEEKQKENNEKNNIKIKKIFAAQIELANTKTDELYPNRGDSAFQKCDNKIYKALDDK